MKKTNVQLCVEMMLKKLKNNPNEWITLKFTDIQQELNIHPVTVSKALKTLQSMPNIETRTEKSFGANKKRLQYKFIEKSSIEDTNIKPTPMDKKYKNISVKEMEYIIPIIEDKTKSLSRIDIIKMYRIVNVLAGLGARTKPVKNFYDEIYNTLISPKQETQAYVRILEALTLAATNEEDTQIKLYLSSELKPENDDVFTKQQKSEPVETKHIALMETGKTESTPEIVPESTTSEKELSNEEVQQKNEQIVNLLVNNLHDFQGFMDQFKNFFITQTEQLELVQSNSEIEEVKAELARAKIELDKGSHTLNRLCEDNRILSNNLNKTKEELKLEKMFARKIQEDKEKSFEFMQERFQIVIAEITNEISDFMKTPEWQLTPAKKATAQNNVVGAITSAMNDILDNMKKLSKAAE